MRAFCSRYTFHFNALRNYLRKLERRPKWQHIRFTYDILSFLWSVQPLRVTPAYTGKRPTPRWVRPNPRDHPRACGEKRDWTFLIFARRGSPPRMRGKVHWRWEWLHCPGITPAHAGKSRRMKGGWPVKRDHPRACGEKLPLVTETHWLPGSPPRMRGKELFLNIKECGGGITPAHAGKRRPHAVKVSPLQDHPRVCGEKYIKNFMGYSTLGSPPRMRGKVACPASTAGAVGITPAYAGKRNFTATNHFHKKDHPRVCGEK